DQPSLTVVPQERAPVVERPPREPDVRRTRDEVEHAPEPTLASPAAPAEPQPPVLEEPTAEVENPTDIVIGAPEAVAATSVAPSASAEAAPPPSPTNAVAPPAPEQPTQRTPVVADVPPRPKPARTRAVEPDDPLFYPEPETEPVRLPVETELGGVFYLLNLALFLELYPDFSRPLDPALELDPWDLLALLAPRLLDDPSRGDPLWRLLARLAGRTPRERPGRNFDPPAAWRTPPAWLAPFDHEGTWRWSAARDALRVVHPAGFPVLAVPLEHAET